MCLEVVCYTFICIPLLLKYQSDSPIQGVGNTERCY